MGRFREAVTLTLLIAIVSAVSQVQPLVNPVQNVVDAGLMSLSADGSFRAEDSLTRAELASILVKTFDVQKRQLSHGHSFHGATVMQDVSSFHWAYSAIQSVVQTGVMTTYSGHRFLPNQTVTRAEGFAAIAQAYGTKPLPPQRADAILKKFPDGETIPPWARPSMAVVVSKGWVNVRDNASLAPDEPLTRGDLAHALSIYLSQNPARQSTRSTSADLSEQDLGVYTQCVPPHCAVPSRAELGQMIAYLTHFANVW